LRDLGIETFPSLTVIIFIPLSGTVNQTKARVSNLLMDVRHPNFQICPFFLLVLFCVKRVKVEKKNGFATCDRISFCNLGNNLWTRLESCFPIGCDPTAGLIPIPNSSTVYVIS
jgi:hypothetical protein